MRPPWHRLLALAPVAVLALASPAPVRGGVGSTVAAADGTAVDPFAEPTGRAVVLFFVGVDCPISNRYAPEVKRIYREFAPQGVRFYLVYPDPDVTPAAAEEHAEAYGYPFPALLDPSHRLVERAAATVLSEAAVLTPRGELLYHGRIDDRFVDFGKARAAPTRRDLREALAAVLAGRPVPHPKTQAIGCFIPRLVRDTGG